MRKQTNKKTVSDAQFKHQQIFLLEGMKVNLMKIQEKFPDGFDGSLIVDRVYRARETLDYIIKNIKCYTGEIRRPK